MYKTLLAALLVLLYLTGAAHGQQKTTTTKIVPFTGRLLTVIDGDTVLVAFKGEEKPYDLEGIDAPEIGQPFGDKAKEALEAMLAKTRRPALSFVIETKESAPGLVIMDRHTGAAVPLMPGSKTATNKGILIRAGTKSANIELVRQGLARSLSDKYSRFEDEAKRAKRGLWSEDDPNEQGDGDDLIEWTSTSGTSVLARLVDVDPNHNTITLERANGTRITVALDKLSDDSRKVATALARELRKGKRTIGKWYWRCPAKNERDFRIISTLTESGGFYKLTEVSTGHSQSPDSELSYFYQKRGDVYVAVDERNGDERRCPFRIDQKGDRLVYYRRLVIGGRVITPGGKFLDIHYADKADAEKWTRDNETFPPIELPTR